MATEKEIQEKVQAVIQELSLFADSDVVINDWSVVDRSNIEAPYVIIETADDFESLHPTMTPVTRYGIPIILIERFVDWKESLDLLRDRRQQLQDAFNSGDSRSGSGLNIARIYNNSEVTPYYDKLIPPELQAEALPIFLMQRIILETELF